MSVLRLSRGDCEAIGGVVVQDRLGETHVLAAAFDLRVTTDRGTTLLTVAVTAESVIPAPRGGVEQIE